MFVFEAKGKFQTFSSKKLFFLAKLLQALIFWFFLSRKRTDKKKLNLALILLNLAAKCFDLVAKSR